MSNTDRHLIAHLMRRAGFSATSSELDALISEKTYEEMVDDLVNPERFPAVDQSFVDRYYGGKLSLFTSPNGCTGWSTPRDPWKRKWHSFFIIYSLLRGGRASI